MFFHSYEEETQLANNLNDQLDENLNKTGNEIENDDVHYNKKSDGISSKLPIFEKSTNFCSKDEPPKESEIENVNILKCPIMSPNLLEKIIQENREISAGKEKKKCGRKRKREDAMEEKVEHNKFSDDNVRRRCKHLVLKNTMDFINGSIKRIYNGNIGNGIFKKELQTINQKQMQDATITFNQNFLNKSLGDIFSEDISGRYTNLPSNHNKLLIMKLIDEPDEEKKNYFINLFNITFINALKHFNGQIVIPELIGLKCFRDLKDEVTNKYPEDGEDYYVSLKYYFDNFEEIILNKRARKARKKKE